MSNEHPASSLLRRLLRAAFVLCALFLFGCRAEVERIVEEAVEQNYPVEANARISVKNTDGSIRLYGADTREVKIQAIKKAYGRERLEKININVTAKPGSLSIDTVYPPKPRLGLADRSGTVDYIIVVPQTCTISRLELASGEMLIEGMRGSRVSANLVNGRLFDHNCFGEHQLFVANGGLDVAFDWWEGERISVDAKVVNGNIRAFIPGDAAFHLLATTDGGNIGCDFSEKEERHRGPVQKVDTKVGEGGQAEITLQSTNGNIRVVESNP